MPSGPILGAKLKLLDGRVGTPSDRQGTGEGLEIGYTGF